jgi:hypothetical protein
MNREPDIPPGRALPAEDDAFREAVRKTAYFLWEQDGRPHGRHEEYYLRALDQHRREREYDQWLEDGPDVE